MRKPVVNYKEFRFSKLFTPEYSHLLLLLGWIIYFVMYYLTERFIPTDRCYVVHCFLDDIIPFCEVFVIPYVLWYGLIAWSLIYFALYNTNNFRGMMKFIIFTQVVAMIIYIAFPNRQDLRPDLSTLGRENIFTNIVGWLYSVDTNTNVCPSLHVAYSLGIASTWAKEKRASIWTRTFVIILCVLICLSTAFIKQHSTVDAFVALGMCVFAEMFGFWGYWKLKIKKKSLT